MKSTLMYRLIVLAALLSGCNLKATDDNWALVSSGQEKALVLQLMGEPSLNQKLTLLGVEMDRLSWESRYPARFYQADFVFERVVTKRSESNSLIIE